jgi:hypothetical protein
MEVLLSLCGDSRASGIRKKYFGCPCFTVIYIYLFEILMIFYKLFEIFLTKGDLLL